MPSYIIAKHKRDFYEAPFKRITQLLVQVHKFQVSVRLCDCLRHDNYVASSGKQSTREGPAHTHWNTLARHLLKTFNSGYFSQTYCIKNG